MKAYVVLDGGGVKGAALAGCLKAAEQLEIEPIGFAGTSAGAIVALLANVGYSGGELHRVMTSEIDFLDFLDDRGEWLSKLRMIASGGLPGVMRRPLLAARTFVHFRRHYGLYASDGLQQFLFSKVIDKVPSLRGRPEFTFEELKAVGLPPLKIVVSDIRMGRSVVYASGATGDTSGSVLDAVRASMSYPLVFQPVRANTRYLVDGGLTSNLPIHVFEREREASGLPVIAFDLTSAPRDVPTSAYDLKGFFRDMVDTAISSSDRLAHRLVHGVHHVEVEVPADISAMDFHLTPNQKQQLFDRGVAATLAYFARVVPYWTQVENEVERVQALHAEPGLVKFLLEAAVRDLEQRTGVPHLRSHVMLPTGRGTRIVAYQFGMDGHSDQDLELRNDAGCSGESFVEKTPVFADLEAAHHDYETWGMTAAQQARIPRDRRAMLSVPIFKLQKADYGKRVADLDVLGNLSIDTDVCLVDTHWLDPGGQKVVVDAARRWADILAKVLVPI